MNSKWIRILFVAISIVVLAAAVCLPQYSEAKNSVQCSGTAHGFGGDVTVNLTIKNGKIVKAIATGADETPGIGSRAIEAMPAAMEESGSIHVDTTSGATFTSNGILDAAVAAIQNAGLEGYGAELIEADRQAVEEAAAAARAAEEAERAAKEAAKAAEAEAAAKAAEEAAAAAKAAEEAAKAKIIEEVDAAVKAAEKATEAAKAAETASQSASNAVDSITAAEEAKKESC